MAKLCTTDYFKTFITADVIGLELCGSLKNVVALAVGMAHGAGFGENTAAMIETRGLTEIKDVGTGAGALPETFYGLAGVGDLIATCGSNRVLNGSQRTARLAFRRARSPRAHAANGVTPPSRRRGTSRRSSA